MKYTWCERMRQVALVLTVVFVVTTMMSVADLASAKHGVNWRDITQAGWALWAFIILGSLIILLQLVPAVIMFFSMVGGVHKAVPTKECCPAKEECKE